VRASIADGVPLFVRISASDWTEGGWTIEDSIRLANELLSLGVDLIDTSSGGNVHNAKITVGPGYQVQFAEAIKHGSTIKVSAVGAITDPIQANAIIESGQADAVMLGREMLRNPRWPLHAAHVLGADIKWPAQLVRGKLN
jgi:2,4-dienoyl-CoA reductase-like NADH-dependent reductase (Old Yellow Enzyme family)